MSAIVITDVKNSYMLPALCLLNYVTPPSLRWYVAVFALRIGTQWLTKSVIGEISGSAEKPRRLESDSERPLPPWKSKVKFGDKPRGPRPPRFDNDRNASDRPQRPSYSQRNHDRTDGQSRPRFQQRPDHDPNFRQNRTRDPDAPQRPRRFDNNDPNTPPQRPRFQQRTEYDPNAPPRPRFQQRSRDGDREGGGGPPSHSRYQQQQRPDYNPNYRNSPRSNDRNDRRDGAPPRRNYNNNNRDRDSNNEEGSTFNPLTGSRPAAQPGFERSSAPRRNDSVRPGEIPPAPPNAPVIMPSAETLATPAPYHVERSASNFLPVYTDYKRGGNLHLTLVRKVSGDLKVLREELVAGLQKSEEDVNINWTTSQIVVKGHCKEEVEQLLSARGM